MLLHEIEASVEKFWSTAKLWSAASIGSCVAGFVHSAIPYLQVIALLLSIASAVKAWRAKK